MFMAFFSINYQDQNSCQKLLTSINQCTNITAYAIYSYMTYLTSPTNKNQLKGGAVNLRHAEFSLLPRK
jgi:hypothetical protein